MKKTTAVILLLISTLAVQAQTLFSENFEGNWTTASTLAGWTSTGTANSEWHRHDYTTGWTNTTSGLYSPSAAENSLYSARFHSYSAANGVKGSLITPEINLTGVVNKKLEFYYINYNGSDKLNVFLSTDNGASWGSTISTSSAGTGSNWVKQSVMLNTTANNIKLKFEGTSDNGSSDIGLDQITVKNISELDPPVISAPTPNPLQASTGSNIFVTVTVTDASAIDNVKLTYKKGSWTWITATNMTYIGNNQYSGIILWDAYSGTTAEPVTGSVKFSATDALGNSVTSSETTFQWIDMDEIYAEGFETFYPDITSSPWKTFSTDGDIYNFTIGRPGSGAEAANGFFCLMSKSSTLNSSYQNVPLNTDNYVVLPQISIPADNGQHIYLAYSVAGTSTTPSPLGEEHYKVKTAATISNPPQASDFTTTIADETTVTGYKRRFININDFKGQMIYLAFEHQQENKNVFRLDDIEIRKVTDTEAPVVAEIGGLSSNVNQALVPVIKVTDNVAIKAVKAYYTVGSGNEIVQNLSISKEQYYAQNEAYYYLIIPAESSPVSGTIKFETEDIFGNKNTTTNSVIEWQPTSSIEQDNNCMKTELMQNYPNPFNPTTQISFNLSKENTVKLAVYNAEGKEVAELLNGVVKSGLHSIDFNAENLNSGIYFYKLTTGNLIISKKMMLLK